MTKTYIITIDEKEAPGVAVFENEIRISYPSAEIVGDLNNVTVGSRVSIPRLHCKKCGHDWIPKVEVVRMCSKCKSIYWDK